MQHRLFKPFLALYTAVLLYHIAEHGAGSWYVLTALATGFCLALLAHARSGYGTTLLLIIHMSLEWSEYGRHESFSLREVAFYGAHTVLDFIFLWQEAKAHFPKFKRAVVSIVSFGLAVLFVFVHESQAPIAANHAEGLIGGIIEMAVLGGILGCTLSHLFHRSRILRFLKASQ